MGHIQLNYAFLLFWRILGEILWKLLFLVKNDYLRKKVKNTKKFCFSKQVWKRANPEVNYDLL